MGLHAGTGVASERVLGVASLTQNSTTPFDLLTNSVIEEINFQLTGTLVLANYTAVPTILEDGIENLIRSIRLTGNAKVSGAQSVSFSNVDARYLRLKTAIVHGTFPDRTDVGTGNGTYQFESNFTKFFGVKRLNLGRLGNDITWLDTRKLQSLVVNFDTRDVGALVVPGSGTGGMATLSNLQMKISVRERMATSSQKGSPYIKETLTEIPLANYGSGIDRNIVNSIPLSNFLQRQYLWLTAGDAAGYSDGNDSIISTNLKPEGAHVKTVVVGNGGQLTRLDVNYSQQQSNNRHLYKLEDWPAGVVVLDYARTGAVRDLLNLTGANGAGILNAYNVLDLSLVANETNTLTIVNEEFVPQ